MADLSLFLGGLLFVLFGGVLAFAGTGKPPPGELSPPLELFVVGIVLLAVGGCMAFAGFTGVGL